MEDVHWEVEEVDDPAPWEDEEDGERIRRRTRRTKSWMQICFVGKFG